MQLILRTICLLGVLLYGASLSGARNANVNPALAPQIIKVEPPSWWAKHSINPVRLLIRGANLQDANIKSVNTALKVSNVRHNARGDYLFFDLMLAPEVKVGTYEIVITNPNGAATFDFEVLPPLNTRENFRGIGSYDVIYLIMTDRFANGDQSNDNPPAAPASANNRSNPRAWHGGDFQGVIDHLDYLQELGVSAIWLTPWYDNPNDANECDKPWCPYTNYHGYHAIDYYGVEDHFGTLAKLQELVRAAHSRGIKVIQDQVANHVGLQHAWAKSAPLEDWFSPFAQNNFNNSVALSPNASVTERDNLLRGWFNELLPDMNQDEPEVARYEIQNALWWIGVTGIDGIRQDTLQYMPRAFIRDWSQAIKKQYPNFWMVGEVFETDAAQTAFFQGGKEGWDGVDTQLPSVFDFKLWDTSNQVFTGKAPMRALRDALKYDGLYPNVNNITTLSSNHDTKRFMSLDGAIAEGAMLHMAFLLSARGIPQIYYGEELGMTGGDDPDNRQDFPGGWREDKTNKFVKAGRTTAEQKMFEWTDQWITLRRKNQILQSGKTIDLFYNAASYVFARTDGCAIDVIGINNAAESSTLKINPKTLALDSKTCLTDVIGARSFCNDERLGEIVLTLAPKSVRYFNVLRESIPTDCMKGK